jgi:murein DD-endopeptidase MepM/ murein hydrolase activator NlpD
MKLRKPTMDSRGETAITSHYGARAGGFHAAIDLSSRGMFARAVMDGVVLLTKTDGRDYGGVLVDGAITQANYIVIDHGEGIVSSYYHMDLPQNQGVMVAPGQRVRAGQILGRIGNTGYSTGPHLHFVVTVKGSPINPANYIDWTEDAINNSYLLDVRL